MHPAIHGNCSQSLAEAIVPVGATTLLHRHRRTEGIIVGKERFDVAPGDTVSIMPNTPHQIANSGDVPLTILCCCSPAYAHEDTELL